MSYSYPSTKGKGAQRKVTVTPARVPKPRVSPSAYRRVAAESVVHEGGKVYFTDFAHVRTKMPSPSGRAGYEYRGAGPDLSPRQLAAARQNLVKARAARRRRG